MPLAVCSAASATVSIGGALDRAVAAREALVFAHAEAISAAGAVLEGGASVTGDAVAGCDGEATRGAVAIGIGAIAGLLLTTEALITEEDEDDEPAAAPGGHGHHH